jgi:hypothetical protein
MILPRGRETVERLTTQYVAACLFDRPTDEKKIIPYLRQWWKQISKISVEFKIIRTSNELNHAARAAWAARAARDAWDARNAWDASWYSITAIGALAKDNQSLYHTWLPFFRAFQAGLWLLYVGKETLYVVTLPEVHTDANNRLHNATDLAFRMYDIREYYWHGVRVDEDVIMHPEKIAVEQIEVEQNAEVRRVLIERYGLDRYIQESGAIATHQDRFGTLWHKPQRDDEDIWTVEVINTTPETDGTYKHYWLRVDPRQYQGDVTRYAQAAVASTWRHKNGTLFFKSWRDYCPDIES